MARVIGCDFSSRPSARKAIVIAHGTARRGVVELGALERLHSLDAFCAWLAQEQDWIGGFDFPFGLPRELVRDLGWPTEWLACMRHYAGLSRQQIRALFSAYCAGRPAGAKFAHRATDRWAGSSPSMKWVNPPVAYMLHAGVPLLIDAGVHLPGLYPGSGSERDRAGRPGKIALEAYPGLLARQVLGRASYKSDDKARQTPQRRDQRIVLVDALGSGATPLAWRVRMTRGQRESLIEDASADALDAVLCLVQAAWGSRQGWPWFGLPPQLDPLEGWIVSALPEPAGAAADGPAARRAHASR